MILEIDESKTSFEVIYWLAYGQTQTIKFSFKTEKGREEFLKNLSVTGSDTLEMGEEVLIDTIKPIEELRKIDPHTGERYAEDYRGQSYTRIEVLNFLKGRPYDNVARGYIDALRPSSVSIGYDGKMICRPWRVMVEFEDEITKEKIKKITQEVNVGLYGDIQNGHDLDMRLKKGETE